MSYRVLARKCRPQTFDEVIGQKHVTRTLRNAIQEGRIAHAFLFTGERGVGKTSIARILAKCLNCHSGPSAEPCGSCPSCIEITNGNSIDVHEIDGASNTSVEDVRVLRENVKYMPSRDRRKIYIIDEVHMLSNSAFNALLKTLEEPPGHVVFIFATTEPHKIPDTIISRCLRFDFKRIPSQEIIEHLEAIARSEQVAISRQGLSLIAREADGSMRDAQTIFERAIAYCGAEVKDADLQEMLGHIDRQVICRLLKAVLDEDAAACIETLDGAYQYGIDLQQLYYGLLETIRDLMMLKAVKDPAKLMDLSDGDMKLLKELEAIATRQELLRLFRLCFSSEADIVRSAMPRIAFEVCLLEMIELKRAMPLEEIMERLSGIQPAPSRASAPLPAAPAREAVAPRPAAAPQPPTAVPKAPAQPRSAGAEAFCSHVQKSSPSLWALLAHGTVQDLPAGGISILFPAGSFFLEQLKEQENQAKLAALAAECFGKAVPVTVGAGGEKKKTGDPDGRQQQGLTREKALHNPAIRKIIDTFGGSIVDIRQLAQGDGNESQQYHETGAAASGADDEAEQ